MFNKAFYPTSVTGCRDGPAGVLGNGSANINISECRYKQVVFFSLRRGTERRSRGKTCYTLVATPVNVIGLGEL